MFFLPFGVIMETIACFPHGSFFVRVVLEHFHERHRLGKRGQVPKARTALRVLCTFGT